MAELAAGQDVWSCALRAARDTLIYVHDVKRRNVTLSIPEDVLKQARVLAARRNQSISAMLVESLRKIVEEQDSEELRHRRFLHYLQNPPGRSGDGIMPTRDELHER